MNKRRTGIKIFFRKIIYFIKHPYKENAVNGVKFPAFGENRFRIDLWLWSLINEIKETKLNDKLGFLHSKPHPVAVKVWRRLLPFNPNNMGSMSKRHKKYLGDTERSEQSLISMLVDLYGGIVGKWTGYMTTGATEGNLFAVWMARNYLNSNSPGGKACLLANSFTHYSVRKAADITGIKYIEMGVDRNRLSINPVSLENKIRSLSGMGYKAFIIPLTLGYTQTGANDDFRAISKTLSSLEKQLKIKCFVWIDAAINGLVLPFTRADFRPLRTGGISLITLDFHKTGMCPIPSGIVLYEKNFRKYVSRKVAYLDHEDDTISGSRSGIAPTAALAIVKHLGRIGFKKYINASLEKKNGYIKIIKKLDPDLEIFNDKDGLSLALICKKPLSDKMVNELGIFAKKYAYKFDRKTEELYIYKINFIPNI
ncbi:MAG: pyridoxal-dependent decarboxylase [Patescibacteria group bacterium]